MIILLVLAQAALALAVLPKKEQLYIGQFVRIQIPNGATVTDAVGEKLPAWLMHYENFLYGIPRSQDTGKTFVEVSDRDHKGVIEFNVLEEEPNPCGERTTMWLEIFFAEANGFDLIQRIKNLLELKRNLDDDVYTKHDVTMNDIRLYEKKYSKEAREVEFFMEEELEEYAYTITIKTTCTFNIDPASDILDAVLGGNLDKLGEVITKGRILSRKERGRPEDVLSNLQFSTNAPEEMNEEVFTTTTVSSTAHPSVITQRTTRKVDNVPVKLNSLPSMHCVRGVYCELPIPAKTFVDAEDGDANKLKLEVKSIPDGNEWVQVHKMRLRSVPMKEGEFQMRLEARDKSNQLASAPFTVIVAASPLTTHTFHFEVEKPSVELFEKDPQLLIDFVHHLSRAFKSPINSVVVNKVEKASGSSGFSVVHWSNATLSSKTCPKQSIEAMKAVMLTKKNYRPKIDFIKAMTAEFILKNIGLNLTGSCVESTSLVSTAPSVTAGRDAGFGWLALAAALAMLLLLIALALICFLLRKPKKEKPSEFVSKGLPVVFPEEVGEDSETAHATTPMLVKEERPPLKVSQHENPLYKPPPPIAAASPRGTTPGLAGTPAQQRLPPPYIPP